MDVQTEAFNALRAQKSLFAAFLEARSRFGGKKIAIVDVDDNELDYTSVTQAAFALGSALKRITSNEKNVGVLLPTGAGAVISLLALSAYGKTPCMLNFTAGENNLHSAIKIAELKTIVTARKFVEMGGFEGLIESLSAKADIIYLEDVKEELDLIDKGRAGLGTIAPWLIRSKPHWNSPSVILFTSGTEGTPKGVALSHKNVVSNVLQILQHVPDVLTPDDIIFNPLPTFHCFGLTAGAILPLLGGMKVVFHPSPLQVKEIPKRISQTRSTILFATDTFLNQYARASGEGELTCLRYAVCGAERVRDETRSLVEKNSLWKYLKVTAQQKPRPLLPSISLVIIIMVVLDALYLGWASVLSLLKASHMPAECALKVRTSRQDICYWISLEKFSHPKRGGMIQATSCRLMKKAL